MLFFKSINITSYYALTSTPGAARRDVTGTSYRGRFDYTDRSLRRRRRAHADRRATSGPRSAIVRRTDIRRSFGQLRFSPRPRQQRGRSASSPGRRSLDYVTDAPAIDGAEPRGVAGSSGSTSSRATRCRFEYSREYELLPARFADRARRDRAGRRLHLPRPAASSYIARAAAPRVGPAVGARPARCTAARSPRSRYSGRWGVVPQLLDRAERDAELGAAAVRRLHRAPGRARASR